MKKSVLFNRPITAVTTIIAITAIFLISGCVERKLTIDTEPQGALVTLNDEEIGTSPVTVEFNWYGHYNVRISKEGFETLKTHRELRGPWYDRFLFDFFAQIYPKRIVDSYEWTFKLEKQRPPARETLIEKALQMQSEL